jgi:hypothetical protein
MVIDGVRLNLRQVKILVCEIARGRHRAGAIRVSRREVFGGDDLLLGGPAYRGIINPPPRKCNIDWDPKGLRLDQRRKRGLLVAALASW